MKAIICFEADNDFVGIMIRLFTCRGLKNFARTPNHVYVELGGLEYEALGKVKCQPIDPRRAARNLARIDVSITDTQAAFLRAQVGDAYDWLGITLDAVGVALPGDVQIVDRSRSRWTCSRLVGAMLGIADESVRLPVSPRDLLAWLRARPC